MNDIKIRGTSKTYSPKYDWSKYFTEIRERRGQFEFYFQDNHQGYFSVRRDTIIEAEQRVYELRLQFEECNEEHDWKRSHPHNKSSQFGDCKKCFLTRNYVFEPETVCLICNKVAHFHLSRSMEHNDEDYCSTHYFEALNEIVSLEKDKELDNEIFNSEPFDKFYYKSLKQELEVYKSGALSDKTEDELNLFFSDNLSKFILFVHKYIVITLNVDYLRNVDIWKIEAAIEPKFTKELVCLYLKNINLLDGTGHIDTNELNKVILTAYKESSKQILN